MPAGRRWRRSDDGRRAPSTPCARPGGVRRQTARAYWLGYTWAVLGALRALAARRPLRRRRLPRLRGRGPRLPARPRAADDATAVVVAPARLARHVLRADRLAAAGRPAAPRRRVHGGHLDRAPPTACSRPAASPQLTASGSRSTRAGSTSSQARSTASSSRPARRRAANGRGPRLLFVGNLVANKGVATVLEAFVRLAGEHPGLTLAIAGSATRESPAGCEERAARGRHRRARRVLGFVEHEDLPALYRSADSSPPPRATRAGSGSSTSRRWPAACPWSRRRAGGAGEAIEHGETGLLLEHGDSRDDRGDRNAARRPRGARQMAPAGASACSRTSPGALR